MVWMKWMLSFFLSFLLHWIQPNRIGKQSGNQRSRYQAHHHLDPSLKSLSSIDDVGKFALTSVTVQHHGDSRWYLPHYHARGSSGWNRTFVNGNSNRPTVCNIRFFAVAMEKTMNGFVHGGTAYLTVRYHIGKKTYYHGFEKNETSKLHCYYSTSKGTGSDFLDQPKTVGLVVYCPLDMDMETGEYLWKNTMQNGYYCHLLSDRTSYLTLHLRPTAFPVPLDYAQYIIPPITTTSSSSTTTTSSSSSSSSTGSQGSIHNNVGYELIAEAINEPLAARYLKVSDLFPSENVDKDGSIGTRSTATATIMHRPHAVCTVQTFRNAQTGPMLYLFVSYYHRLGWRVIVYDRFGFHREFIEDLLPLPGFDYYNYTIFQQVNPTKYNEQYAKNQGFGYKIYYKLEKNWGYAAKTNGTMADVADQDADKARTYDHSRIEYAHLDTIMYIDSDELLYCPQAGIGLKAQRRFQQRMFNGFIAQGLEEIRMSRLPYSGLAPPGFDSTNRTQIEQNDFTARTAECMQHAYDNRSVAAMLGCWSQAGSYDDFPKSADMAGVCPFHYNHWSCDGMRGGGRDGPNTKRCRCKVGFELINWLTYQPVPEKCHLYHFNNNKYRFQYRRIEANREKKRNQEIRRGRPISPDGPSMHHGDATKVTPLVAMYH